MWHNRKEAGLKLYRDTLLTKLHRSDSMLSAVITAIAPQEASDTAAFGARF